MEQRFSQYFWALGSGVKFACLGIAFSNSHNGSSMFRLHQMVCLISMLLPVACRSTGRLESNELHATRPVSSSEIGGLQVALVKFNRSKCNNDPSLAFVSYCTSTRITEDTLLTAAHCVIQDGLIKETYVVKDVEAAARIIPARDDECIPTAPIAKALKDLGSITPTAILVNKVKDSNADFALLKLDALWGQVMPFSSRKPEYGIELEKFGFGVTDCREKTPDGRHRYIRSLGSKYGFGMSTSTIVNRTDAAKFDVAASKDPKRPFERHLLSISGADGHYTCPGDSGAGAFVRNGVRLELAGVHTGGIALKGEDPALKGIFKLETAMSIHGVEFCQFLKDIGQLNLAAQLFFLDESHCQNLFQDEN
jgi:hypothetical protein